MVTVSEGAAWLESLAARYEATARRLRETAVMIKSLEDHDVAGGHLEAGAVPISEAIRIVLGRSDRALMPAEIWQAMTEQRVKLTTKSANPRNLIDATLQSMAQSRQVRRENRGWILTGTNTDRRTQP